MKRFEFSLDKVMEWRRTEAKLEETKLELMYAELAAIDARERSLNQDRADSDRALIGAPTSTGLELAALDRFRRYTRAECAKVSHARAACRARIAAQLQVVSGKRRDVRLLERLREQRLKTWNTEFSREIDAQADEAYLAKWTGKRTAK